MNENLTAAHRFLDQPQRADAQMTRREAAQIIGDFPRKIIRAFQREQGFKSWYTARKWLQHALANTEPNKVGRPSRPGGQETTR